MIKSQTHITFYYYVIFIYMTLLNNYLNILLFKLEERNEEFIRCNYHLLGQNVTYLKK